jgi:REP-associated tyrosine transposase
MPRKRAKWYRSNNNIVFACYFHVVWSTKYRKPVLVNSVDERLKQVIADVCQERKAFIVAMEVMPDHVHLLVDVDPQFGICHLIKLIKGRSSFRLRKEYPELKETLPSLWTNSYSVTTTGRATLKIVKRYVERQKDHHAQDL